MKIEKKNEINQKIRMLEEQRSSLSSREVEVIIHEILLPLMEEEGYQVKTMSQAGDKGIDYVAIKQSSSNGSPATIGIEYKHYQRNIGSDTVNQLISKSMMKAFQRTILITTSSFTLQARIAASRIEPIAIKLMDLSDIKAWIASKEVDMNIDKLEIEEILKAVSHKFACLVAKDHSYLYKIEWRELERMMASIFEGIGFKVELTPGSKDGGKDIILCCQVKGKEKTYIVEIKHWRSGVRVGQSAVRDFLNVIVNEKRDSGLYLSTYGYCNNAFETLSEISRQKIRFGEQQKIISLCNTYMKINAGIWSSSSDLSEILFEQTV